MTGAERWFDRWWLASVPAERLAWLRIIVGGFALGYVLVRARHLMSYGGYRADQFEPVGVANILAEPLPGAAVSVLVIATLVAGVAFVAGWRFGASGPVFALLLLWVTTYRNSFGQVFHTENLLVLHVLILALSPAAIMVAVRPTAATGEGMVSGWPIRLMCVVTVATYAVAGITKLQNAGLDWVTEDVLRNYVAYDNLRKAELGDPYSPLGAWLVGHAWLFRPLAALSLVIELGAPLALLGRRITAAWALAAWTFHLGVFAIMFIVFPHQMAGVAFAPFFAVERAGARVRAWGRWLAPGRATGEQPAARGT